MSKQKSLSFGLLIGSVFLGLLFNYANELVKEALAEVSPTPAAANPTDIAPYCQYRPDWPVFRAGQEKVQHSLGHSGPPDAPGTRDGYEILLPRVNRATTEYRVIPLKQGDQLTINACGCVQTGGVGDTWKLYVDPRGKDSDKLYHGLIFVENAAKVDLPFSPKIKGFVRISDLIAWQSRDSHNRLHILHDSYLTLGYEDGDEDYNDNGYSGHDDGNDGQCKGVGGAAVSIVIDHH